MSPPPPIRSLAAVVLAAGKGTRMNSDLPKVAHVAAGRPLVKWVVDACRSVGTAPIVLVVGHRAEDVVGIFEPADPTPRTFGSSGSAFSGPATGAAASRGAACSTDLRFVTQPAQLGTGHAVQQAEPALFPANANGSPLADDVLVLYGDGPLIRAETLHTLVERHRASGAAATLATAVLPDPTGYGRIVRDANGDFMLIREQKDANDAERAIREVNPGYYCFRTGDLFDALRRVGRANASGEIYLTDVFEILLRAGRRIEVVAAVPPEDVLSVNTPQQLLEVESILRARSSTGVKGSAGNPTETSAAAGAVNP